MSVSRRMWQRLASVTLPSMRRLCVAHSQASPTAMSAFSSGPRISRSNRLCVAGSRPLRASEANPPAVAAVVDTA